MDIVQSITSAYSKTSTWCKIMLFTCILLVWVVKRHSFGHSFSKEGFTQQEVFTFKTGTDVYDEFYADIYDHLVFNNIKNEYEIGQFMNKANLTEKSVVLDVGCGTGHHVASLSSNGLNVLGIDVSPAMISKAQEQFPDNSFQVADAQKSESFRNSSFTHILCMYFTVYCMKDRDEFINNCYNWLAPGGYFFIHLVDRDRFDPILPPGNPLMYVSPQRYAKKRITTTKVKFTDFSYSADFQLNKENNLATFTEKFKDDNSNKTRKNEHTLYMPDHQIIVDEIQDTGFLLESMVDLIQCQYEYQYLYIFKKPF